MVRSLIGSVWIFEVSLGKILSPIVPPADSVWCDRKKLYDFYITIIIYILSIYRIWIVHNTMNCNVSKYDQMTIKIMQEEIIFTVSSVT